MKGVVVSLGLLLSTLAFGAAPPAGGGIEKAQESARAWLALLDAGKYAATWDNASDVFQQKTPKKQWTEQLEAARNALGNASSRELVSVKLTDALPGAPKGSYAVLEFRTEFQKKGTVIEAITPARDAQGRWKVAGYSLYGTK